MNRRWLGAGLLVVAVVLDIVATASLAAAMGTANDLFPRWYGTRAWLLRGLDPYSAAVTREIEQAMGGAPGGSRSAFVFGFVYPAYVLPLLTPLAVLPFQWAATCWLLLAQGCALGGAYLCWRAAGVEWNLRPQPANPALILAVLFPASLMNLAFGQFAGVVFFCLAAAWYLAVRGWPRAAGGMLVLAMVKPSLALLPVASLLLWALSRRQWPLLATWLAGWAMLGLGLVAWLPGWPAAFWESTQTYAQVADAVSASGLLARLLAPPGWEMASDTVVWLAVLGALGAVCGFRPGHMGRYIHRLRARPFAPAGIVGAMHTELGRWRSIPAGWFLSAGTVFGAWGVPPLYEWNSIVLLVPIITWLRVGSERRPGRRALIRVVMLLALFAATVPLIARWPSESRLLWPSIALAAALVMTRSRSVLSHQRTAGEAAVPATPAGGALHGLGGPVARTHVLPSSDRK